MLPDSKAKRTPFHNEKSLATCSYSAMLSERECVARYRDNSALASGPLGALAVRYPTLDASGSGDSLPEAPLFASRRKPEVACILLPEEPRSTCRH